MDNAKLLPILDQTLHTVEQSSTYTLGEAALILGGFFGFCFLMIYLTWGFFKLTDKKRYE